MKKGDRVTIYMPMIPEAAVAMLACARIGAVHSVVFGGFSPESLAGRIGDCASTLVITADEGVRGGRKIPLKANVDAAIASHGLGVKNVVVVKRTGAEVAWVAGRDVRYEDITAAESPDCEPERMNAEDPLFILYTSGSTGKPKGVLHTSGGYLVYVNYTFACVFDYREEDVFWCTADVGWVTGHSYIVYGPLSNGATSLMFEGVPNHPDTSRFWRVVDKHQVTIFYTAPTAIRALMREGDAPVKAASRKSLRLLGSVGEPINPEAWEWYHRVVGDGRCPVVDTWWQTETGGILISPLPGATELKAGSATRPLPGIQPALVDGHGKILEGATEGNLVLLDSWPGQMRTVYGDHKRFIHTYFTHFRGRYFTGDGARRDEDGYWWITGRVDDVMNVSGHRIGTAEVESALVAHAKVAEAAVVGFPHDIKGQGIYAYVTLKSGESPSDALRTELAQWVRKEIGADRAAGPHPVGAEPAEDPLRQDHAPDPAQDRRQRARPPRRHLDARRSRRRHRPRREPPPGAARDATRGGRTCGRIRLLRNRRRATDARDLEHGMDDAAAGVRCAGREVLRARQRGPAAANARFPATSRRRAAGARATLHACAPLRPRCPRTSSRSRRSTASMWRGRSFRVTSSVSRSAARCRTSASPSGAASSSAATVTPRRSGCRRTRCAGAPTSRSSPARRARCGSWPCT